MWYSGGWTLLVVIAIMLVSWAVLALLARRLPPGLLRDAVAFLPACVTAARRCAGIPKCLERDASGAR